MTNGKKAILQQANKGFTLIELIVTIILVSIISIPLSAFVSQNLEGMVSSRDDALALNLARFEIEKFNNKVYTNISTGTSTTSNYLGYSYDVQSVVSCILGNCNSPSAESVKQITVNVSRAGSSQILVSLTTYIARNISYGP